MHRQDTIRIEGLEIFANHGVLPEENVLGQKFLVSCEMEVDIRPAGLSDRIEDSVNYAEVSQRIKQVMTENTFNLIEACAEHVAKAVLEMDERIRGVWIEISKPWAPVGLPLRTVAVSCERRRHEVFVALGSNLGDSRAQIEEAVTKMDATAGIQVEAVSTLIETEPYGVTDQPSFLNGAARISTLLAPHELLDELHRIEAEAGRERIIHWGPRTLDLDIIFYDDLVMSDDDLCIPHVDMHNRSFVIEPMKELAPYKMHPVLKKRMVEL